MKLTIPRSLLLGAIAAAFPAFGASEELHIDGGTEYGWGNNWYVQVDGVMGGKSSGQMEFLEDNSIMKFTGDIILDGGGFSSVRRRIDLDLSEYAGVVVTVEAAISEGTTPPPGFHLQFSDRSSYYDFSSAFAVPLSNGDSDSAVVTSVYLPMDSFNRGSRGGRNCRGTCELTPSDINGMSVYMLFQEGGFDVRLRSIEAVEEPRAFPLPEYDGLETADDIVGLIRSTISSGGSLYDKSYVELCINMYWSVLNTVLSSDSEAATESVKAVICAGLQQVEDQMDVGDTKQNIAWTLRYAMDAVIADLQGSSRTTVQDWLPTVDEASSMEVLCVGRTSPAQGFMYDPTNEYILVSEDSEDDEEEPPSNSLNDEEEEEPLSANENDSIEPPSNSQTDEEAEETSSANENDSSESPIVSEETDEESPAENEGNENDPLSNSEAESNESNEEEVEVAQIEEPEEENVGESLSESDTEEEQPQANEEEEDEPLSSSENEEGEEKEEVEEPLSEIDVSEEMPESTEEEKEESLSEISNNEKAPQSSKEDEGETPTSSEKEVEEEEKQVEESLSEINSNEEIPQASEEEEEEDLTSNEKEGEQEETPVSNQDNQGDPTIVSEAQEEPPSSSSGTEDKGLTNSTILFDEADPVIKTSAVDSSQFSSSSPSLSGYGFASVVAGFMLLGVAQ